MIYLMEFKITIVKMLTKVSRTMHEKGENFNKDRENTGKSKKKKIREEKNTNWIEKLNREVQQTRSGRRKYQQIQRLGNRTHPKKQKEKRINMKMALGDHQVDHRSHDKGPRKIG